MKSSRARVLLLILFVLAGLSLVAGGGAIAKDTHEDVMYSPESELGMNHLFMYEFVGTDCTVCHNGQFQDAPPSLAGMKKVKMSSSKKACGECHTGDKAPELFISRMDTKTPAYARCEDCHAVK